MTKFQYYVQRLKRMKFKKYYSAAQEAHRASGKNTILLMIDMMMCSFQYSIGYTEYNEFEFYSIGKEKRQTFLNISNSILISKTYNDQDLLYKVEDKGEFTKNFKDFIGRDVLHLDASSFEDFEAFMNKHRKVMAKVVNSEAGRGVEMIDMDQETRSLSEIYQACKDKNQSLVESYFIQHEDLSALSPTSVNTMRVITFLGDDGDVHFLAFVLKLGNGGTMDNFDQGGMYSVLSNDGVVLYPFMDKFRNRFTVHPLTKQELIGFKIPLFEEVKEMLRKAAHVVPEVRYIGWDVAIGQNGPAIIEANPHTGVFQAPPSMTENQEGLLPKYKKYIKF